ncbi:MAG: nitroreductase family protein, partial [Clostridia bacterium]|nr:nitroreductase family protein [Clostridia bacterium]
MEFKDVVKSRYSCKKYSNRQVETEKLTAILEAGRLAPTAKNLQEQHIYVIRSEELLARIDAITPCRYGAPTMLAVAFDRNNVFTYPGGKRDSGIEDASIVATHLILAAADEGVDSCWLNFFDPEKVAQALGLPENEEVLMLLDLGYAAEGAGPLANHSSRKELRETVPWREVSTPHFKWGLVYAPPGHLARTSKRGGSQPISYLATPERGSFYL